MKYLIIAGIIVVASIVIMGRSKTGCVGCGGSKPTASGNKFLETDSYGEAVIQSGMGFKKGFV